MLDFDSAAGISTGIAGSSDQAEGLRRLLGRNMARVIALEAGASGAGKTSVAINVAAALATRGLQVLVIDANSGAANVSGRLGLRPRHDLRDVLGGRCGLDDALLHGPAGVMVLPAIAAARDGHSVRERERFDAIFSQLVPRFDYVLIDVCADAGTGALLRACASESVIVSSTGASAVTAAYALIKRVHAEQPQQRMHVLLNRVANERSAGIVFENLRRVASVHLRATLECLGHVPRDTQVQRAAEGCQPVVEQYPSSVAAAGFHKIADAITDWSHAAPTRARAAVAAPRGPSFSNFALAPAGA